MLTRILEPELMDTAEDAHEYDAMDHSIVNAQFVTDLLEAISDWSLKRPEESPTSFKSSTSAPAPPKSPSNWCAARIAFISRPSTRRKTCSRWHARMWPRPAYRGRITIALGDAKSLPFDAAAFPVVISNSIVHHIAGRAKSSPKQSASPSPVACCSTAIWRDLMMRINCNK